MSEIKKRSLGRGLSALMPQASPASPPAPVAAPVAVTLPPAPVTIAPAPAAAPERSRTYFNAAIEDIYPHPTQPRRKFSDEQINDLADTIRTVGIIQPLIVRARAAGGYELIAGERRWRAAQRVGLTTVPVVVKDVAPAAVFELALIENVQRQDLGPLEEAAAYQRLISDSGLTQDEVAQRVGKDRSTVANSLRLLKLPTAVSEMVENGRLSMGHARALLAIDDARAMEVAARTVLAQQLSVRATEALVRRATSTGEEIGKPKPATTVPAKSASARDVEHRLTQALGAPVHLTENKSGKGGLLEIRYLDLDHLDKILDRLL